MSAKTTLFKIAILNDLLGTELSKINVKNIEDNNVQCKLKNMVKSSDVATKFFDNIFEVDISVEFGDFCDQINGIIDNSLNLLEKEAGTDE